MKKESDTLKPDSNFTRDNDTKESKCYLVTKEDKIDRVKEVLDYEYNVSYDQKGKIIKTEVEYWSYGKIVGNDYFELLLPDTIVGKVILKFKSATSDTITANIALEFGQGKAETDFKIPFKNCDGVIIKGNQEASILKNASLYLWGYADCNSIGLTDQMDWIQCKKLSNCSLIKLSFLNL